MSSIPWVSFDGKDCSGCKYLNERGYCKFTACIIPCTVIATIPEVKPQTNADRIRAMSDEELAKWLGKIQYDTAYFCAGEDKQKYPYPVGWLDWLRQEVKEDE